jgi:hypothetical protein
MNTPPVFSEELVVQMEMFTNENLTYKLPPILDYEDDSVTVEYMLGFAKGFTEIGDKQLTFRPGSH